MMWSYKASDLKSDKRVGTLCFGERITFQTFNSFFSYSDIQIQFIKELPLGMLLIKNVFKKGTSRFALLFLMFQRTILREGFLSYFAHPSLCMYILLLLILNVTKVELLYNSEVFFFFFKEDESRNICQLHCFAYKLTQTVIRQSHHECDWWLTLQWLFVKTQLMNMYFLFFFFCMKKIFFTPLQVHIYNIY